MRQCEISTNSARRIFLPPRWKKNVNVSARRWRRYPFRHDTRTSETEESNTNRSDFKLGESVKVLSMNLTGTVSIPAGCQGQSACTDGNSTLPGKHFRSGDHRREAELSSCKTAKRTGKRQDQDEQITYRSLLRSICSVRLSMKRSLNWTNIWMMR